MSENRNRFRKHIRAAKDWLGRAECSMDKQNDIRGDLNFMLAQAELRRAQETRRVTPGSRWVRQSLPLLAAGGIVLGCMLFFRAVLHTSVPVQAPQQAAYTQEVLPPADMEPVVTTPQEVVSPMVSSHQEEQAPHEMRAAAVSDSPVSVPQTVVQEKPAQQKVNMPSEDMQKLMQSAGKNLRAQ